MYRAYACAVFLLLCGCTNDSVVVDIRKNDSLSTNHHIDTIAAYADSNTSKVPDNTRHPEGIYQGSLPCRSCTSNQHTVAFYSDRTFKREEVVDGNTTGVVRGSWKPENGVIWLFKEHNEIGRYTWKGDTLMYILSDRSYPLTKKPSAAEVNAWKNKKKDGLEFFGIGTEPFWSIEIDEEKAVKFHLADWGRPVVFSPVVVAAADTLVYNLSNTIDSLKVLIYPSFCSDGMSDNVYENRVRLIYNKTVYEGCGLLYK
jgi:uncharacterized membrane protein